MRTAVIRAFVKVLALAMVGAAWSKNKEEAGGGTITIAGEANNHGSKCVSGSTFELEADNEASDSISTPRS